MLIALPAPAGAVGTTRVVIKPSYANNVYSAVTTSSTDQLYGCSTIHHRIGPSFNLTTGRGHWLFIASARSCAAARSEADFTEAVTLEFPDWVPNATGTYTARFHIVLNWSLNATVRYGNHSAVSSLMSTLSSGAEVIQPYPFARFAGPTYTNLTSLYRLNASLTYNASVRLFPSITWNATKGQIYTLFLGLTLTGSVEAFGRQGNAATLVFDMARSGHRFAVPDIVIT